MFAARPSWHARDEDAHSRLTIGTNGRAVIDRNHHDVSDKLAESLLHNQTFSWFVRPRHCDERSLSRTAGPAFIVLKLQTYESTRDMQRSRSIPLEAISLHSAQRLHACRAFSGHRHHCHYKPEDGYRTETRG